MSKSIRTRKHYSEEFKRDAVALVVEQGYTVTEAAKSLGINYTQLRRWKNERERSVPDQILSDNEKEELKRLRKRVRELEMEKDILKKASAYFAKEMK